jgi:hypothetical protein
MGNKTMFITTKEQYNDLINNRIGLKDYNKVYFNKKEINIPSIIEGINYCEDCEIEWDYE